LVRVEARGQTLVHRESTARLQRYAHALQKVRHRGTVHRGERLAAAQRDERSDGGVSGCEVGQLTGTAAESSLRVLTGREEGHHGRPVRHATLAAYEAPSNFQLICADA
jgi:hypothetical protein